MCQAIGSFVNTRKRALKTIVLKPKRTLSLHCATAKQTTLTWDELRARQEKEARRDCHVPVPSVAGAMVFFLPSYHSRKCPQFDQINSSVTK